MFFQALLTDVFYWSSDSWFKVNKDRRWAGSIEPDFQVAPDVPKLCQA